MLGLFEGLLRIITFFPTTPPHHPTTREGYQGECSARCSCALFLDPNPLLHPQHHQIIQQYMVTLENLLFTAELDPHILAVFQQFCALQA